MSSLDVIAHISKTLSWFSIIQQKNINFMAKNVRVLSEPDNTNYGRLDSFTKLTNFKGEDVTKAASQLCGAIAALEIVNQVLW
jgi:hypothetical protein